MKVQDSRCISMPLTHIAPDSSAMQFEIAKLYMYAVYIVVPLLIAIAPPYFAATFDMVELLK